jgi:hypothetical protein
VRELVPERVDQALLEVLHEEQVAELAIVLVDVGVAVGAGIDVADTG